MKNYGTENFKESTAYKDFLQDSEERIQFEEFQEDFDLMRKDIKDDVERIKYSRNGRLCFFD